MVGLDGWTRTRIAGFEVYTDGDQDSARYVIESLEVYLALASGLLPQKDFSPSRPSTVLLFRSGGDYALFGSSATAGHLLPGEDGFYLATHLGVGMGSRLGDSTAVFQHEVVHLLLREQAGREYPRWFDEGFAEFLGATVIRSDVATVGGLAAGRVDGLLCRLCRPMALERLLSFESHPGSLEIGRFYVDSWVFVHYGLLSHGLGGPPRTTQFLAFVDDVAQGKPWRESLETRFQAPLSQVEAEYREHWRLLAESSVHPQAHVEVVVPEARIEFAPVDRAEAAVVLGSYVMQFGSQAAYRLALDYLDVALQESPPPDRALVGAARAASRLGRVERGEELLARVPAALADEPRVREARAELELARCEELEGVVERADELRERLAGVRALYEPVLSSAPDRLPALIGLGRSYVLDPDTTDLSPGIDAFARAIALSPHSLESRIWLARLLLRDESRAAAGEQLRWVIASHPDSDQADEAEDLMEEAGLDRGGR